MLTMVVATEALTLNARAGMSMEADEKDKVETVEVDAPITKETVNLEAKHFNAQIAEAGSDGAAKAAIQELKVDPNLAQQLKDGNSPDDVSTKEGFNVKEGKFSGLASGGSAARSQSWYKSSEPEGHGGGSWMPSIIVMAMVACAAFGAFMASTTVQQEKKGNSGQEMTAMASPVSLGVKPRAPPAALPKKLQEVDVLETFDSFDKKRRGFMERDVLEGLLGPDQSAQEQAAKVVGKSDKLFYHDFRKLVLQNGPVQDAVINHASRKRGSSAEFGEPIKA